MIDLTVLGARPAIEYAISALAQPWGVIVDWQSHVGDGPHQLRFDTVRLDVRFVPAADAVTYTDEDGFVIELAAAHGEGANIRIGYHGTPAADHLAAIAGALTVYAEGADVGGVTRLADAPAGWPEWSH